MVPRLHLEEQEKRELKEELMDPLFRDPHVVGFEWLLIFSLTYIKEFGSNQASTHGVVKELESILDMEMETETRRFSQCISPPKLENSHIVIGNISSIEDE